MSLQKPLEGLLRPPLEWYTTSVATVSGLLCLAYSRQFFLEDGLVIPSCLFCYSWVLIGGLNKVIESGGINVV